MRTKGIISFLILLGSIVVFSKPMAQFFYKQYFHSFVLLELENEIVSWEEGVDDYLATIKEIITERRYEDSTFFCRHTLGGVNKEDSNSTTMYLWAHCGEYRLNGSQIIEGMRDMRPIALHRKKTKFGTDFSYKTVTLEKYSEEIAVVFPWYISPHLINHEPRTERKIDILLYPKAEHYFNLVY